MGLLAAHFSTAHAARAAGSEALLPLPQIVAGTIIIAVALMLLLVLYHQNRFWRRWLRIVVFRTELPMGLVSLLAAGVAYSALAGETRVFLVVGGIGCALWFLAAYGINAYHFLRYQQRMLAADTMLMSTQVYRIVMGYSDLKKAVDDNPQVGETFRTEVLQRRVQVLRDYEGLRPTVAALLVRLQAEDLIAKEDTAVKLITTRNLSAEDIERLGDRLLEIGSGL
jgi:hypothetical protein